MDIAAFESFCFADSDFYRPIDKIDDSQSLIDPGCEHVINGVWAICGLDQDPLPKQGWKIHVATTPRTHTAVVRIVAEVCQELGLPWKFIRSDTLVAYLNGKSSSRKSSGKSIAIYPNQDDLETVVAALTRRLGGFEGPRILTDFAIDDSIIQIRYGGFHERYILTDDGPLLALENQEGELVEDSRALLQPWPSWISPPELITRSLDTKNEQTDSPTIGRFFVDSAIQIGNAGGVYRCHDESGSRFIMKEARPHVAYGRTGKDAIARLRNEIETLTMLTDRGIGFTPRLVDSFEMDGHLFCVQEQLPGIPISRYIAQNSPLMNETSTLADMKAYRERVDRLWDSVAGQIHALHELGYAFCDLHPNNVLVDGEATYLIDFEMTQDVDGAYSPDLGAVGYADVRSRTGREADIRAIENCRIASLVPPAPGRNRIQNFAEKSDAFIRTHFVTGIAERPDKDCWPRVRETAYRDLIQYSDLEFETQFATDPRGYSRGAQAGLAYGSAGVLWAINASKMTVPEDIPKRLQAYINENMQHIPSGLYTGLAGSALALDPFDRDYSRFLIDTILTRPPTGISIKSGLAGVVSMLIDLGYEEQAIELGEVLAERLPECTLKVPGLMNGYTGVAVALARLAALDKSVVPAEAIRFCLNREISRLWVSEDSERASIIHDGKILPYLETGSCGLLLGLACIDNVLSTDHYGALSKLFDVRSLAFPKSTVGGGLFNGFLGIVYSKQMLVEHYHVEMRDARSGDSIDDLHSLSLHLSEESDVTRMIGEGMLRYTHDLSTGSSGLLLMTPFHKDAPIPIPGIT